MSYDIRLCDPETKETLLLDNPHFIHGGLYSLEGTRELWLNVTYNYAQWYYRDGVFPGRGTENRGIRSIYGLSGAESIPVLKNAISTLVNLDEDISEEERTECEKQGCTGYWMPTVSNAIKPLRDLLTYAQLRPDGVWDGD